MHILGALYLCLMLGAVAALGDRLGVRLHDRRYNR